MAKSLMYGFVTHTTNPIAGRFSDSAFLRPEDLRYCVHDCCYCYARGIKEDHPEWTKYSGEYRLDESQLKQYPDGAFVSLQDMGDIGDPMIPSEVTDKILIYASEHPKVTYLTLTKNPQFYIKKLDIMADLTNIIFGVTIETNNFISSRISKAPSPITRFVAMGKLRRRLPEARFLISVEPIMDFHLGSFVNYIDALHPEVGQSDAEPHIAVGYDNHPNLHPDVKLWEPPLEKTLRLISALEARGFKIHRKTLREAIT